MKNHILFLSVYTFLVTLLICIYTYPLVTDFSNIIYGFSGDNFGSIWHSWWIKYANTHGLDPEYLAILNYPFGEILRPEIIEVLWVRPLQFLTNIFDQVSAFNIIALASFPLSALSMYFLIYYIVKDRYISALIGVAFAFAPYHFWQGYAHISLSLIQWLPLYILSLIYFFDTVTAKTGVKSRLIASLFLSSSLFLVTMTTFYYGYFMVLFTLTFLVLKIIYHLFKKSWLLSWPTILYGLLSIILFTLFMSPFMYKVIRYDKPAEQSHIQNRPINDLLSLSTRPWDFFLPAPNHFLLGAAGQKFYRSYITKLTSDYKSQSAFLPERVLYIGFTISVLTLFGLFGGVFRKKYQDLTIVTFGVLVFTLILSSPPVLFIKGFTLYTPNYFLYQYLPFFRAYIRLGVVILILCLILSGIGLAAMMEKRNLRVKSAILLLCLMLILFEFSPRIGSSSTNLKNITKAYEFIAAQGDVSIVEYPRNFDIPDAMMMQTKHTKGFLNPPLGYKLDLFTEIDNPFSSLTHRVLSALGIDYMVVHTEPLYDTQHPIDDLHYTRFMKLERNNMKPVFEDKGVYVYKVPEYNTDLAGAIFLMQDGYEWGVGERDIAADQTGYIYIGNFTDTPLRATLKLNSSQPINILPTIPSIESAKDTYEVILWNEWNKIILYTDKATHLKAELSNIKPIEASKNQVPESY